MFTDTHCHIHEAHFYESDREDVYTRAISSDVRMICIGTNEEFSRQAVEFAATHEQTWATVGVHPHDVKDGWSDIHKLLSEHAPKPRSTSARRELQGEGRVFEFNSKTLAEGQAPPNVIVGIGEIGLDYFYDNSPRDIQIRALEEQLQLAVDYDLPVSFHVRSAFDDFWPIFSNFSGLRGVLHSFTDNKQNLERGLSEDLYVAVNGISTFTKDENQRVLFDTIPLEKMLLETDAPFLTPVPHRGKVNEPAFVRNVAEYHAKRRGVELEHLARVTSTNASTLFAI
jgi:TatD DNase family protein